MIRTLLEKALEEGLAGIGIKIGEREYIEDIRLAAQIDDIKSPKPKDKKEKLFWAVKKSSEYQSLRDSHSTILLRRNSTFGRLELEYIIFGIKEQNEVKSNIDKIIDKMEYDEEGIFISRIDSLRKEKTSLVTIGVRTDKPIEVSDYFIRKPEEEIKELYPHYPKYKNGIRKLYGELNDKIVSATQIINALIEFIKEHYLIN